jgi:hypothetical protein
MRANTRTPRARAAVLLLASGLLLAACGNKAPTRTIHYGPTKLRPARAVTVRAPAGTALEILSPRNDAHEPSTFTVHVAVHGFTLQHSPDGAPPRPGVGFLHFALDNGRYDQPQYSGPNGQLALRMGVNGFYSPAYQPTITYHHIPPGPHTLKTTLVNPDGTPTAIRATTQFRVNG